MSAIDYKIYRNEILNFLSTISIKFDLFTRRMKRNVLLKTGNTIDDDENPYYLNLCGLYSLLDEPMYITSVETNEKILFDVNLKKTYPRTFALYSVNTTEYKLLCDRYPNQVGLIKSIVYPAKNLDSVLNARNFTVLAADYSYLHTNEQESIKQCVEKTLNYIYNRWYIADYDYEEGYSLVFMSSIYNTLYQSILSQRIHNLRTEQVHPLHIWEYLDSKGLADYKSVLSNKQALFLYRNINYLLNNKGKRSNLEILARNLLKDLQVDLVGKTILQETTTKKDLVITRPEFLREDVVPLDTTEQTDESAPEDMEQILFRLKANGYHPNFNMDDVLDKEYKFSRTELNRLPTRLLELKKSLFNTRYMSLLIEFILDSIMYHISLGHLQYTIKYKDKNLNAIINISIQDAILLFNYSHYKESGEDPTIIPKLYDVRKAYKNKKPTSLPKYFTFRKDTWRVDSIINVEQILTDVQFIDTIFADQMTFMDLLSNQFIKMVDHILDVRQSAWKIYQDCSMQFYNNILVRKTVDIDLTSCTSFKEWKESNETINNLLNLYEDLPNNKLHYKELCEGIVTSIFSLNEEMIRRFCGNNKDDTIFYTKLKELFVQLCSYRLTFLETDRKKVTYYTPPGHAFTMEDIVDISSTIVDIDYFEKMSVKCKDTNAYKLKDLGVQYLYPDKVTITTENTINTDIPFKEIALKDNNEYYQPDHVVLKPTGEISNSSTLKINVGCNIFTLI